MKHAHDYHPLLYGELRAMAAKLLAREARGQTLQPTALVNEAYLRLSGRANDAGFASSKHYFGAASEAMRRILIDSARRKKRRAKHQGQRVAELPDELPESADEHGAERDEFQEALAAMTAQDAVVGELVRLHVEEGLTIDAAAEKLDLSVRTAFRYWQYAKAWLFQRLSSEE